ncbi:MAG: SusC/RagA family TonB-linked outer membrane protein, partial [Bacteroidales bacterium]|nr:SusC/RagA family TonB-linked outer membrane protein [Bacteroidales bacterium]
MGRKSISKILVSATILFFCGIVSLHAQTTVVSGTVTDNTGLGVVGASVYVKGTTTGVSTDFDGNYSLTIDGIKDPVLVFSCIGYGEQEITVGKQSKINVVLAEETNTLDEVVFVAYGTMRKGDVTGALTTIKPDDNDMAMPSINSLLEGKIAGLVVNSSSSQVGAASSVTIRGANSLRGDNQPLYVIDNIPQASTGEFSTSAIGGTDFQVEQDPLSSLNPADIVDITVLKDASSTAIYGSRGANGVILITTRKGSEGTVRVHVNANFTVTQPTRLMDMMTLAQYADYRNSRITNVLSQQYHVVGNEVRYNYSGSESTYNAGDPSSYHILYERDWQKEIYTSAFSHQYNVSVDGGSDKVTYYVSAGFKDIKGTVKQTGLYEGSLRMNLSAKLAKTVTLDFMANGSIRQNDMMAGGNTTGGATGAVSRTALDYPPYLMSEDDPDYSNENTTTVLSWLDDYVDKAVNKTFNGSINLRWDISKNFHYSLRTGGNMTT